MADASDVGWEAALDRMTDLLVRDQPFAHIRFGDGELNAACGLYAGMRQPNCDGIVYTEQVAAEMRRVFEEMRLMDPDANCFPGGTCIANPLHVTYLESLGYEFGKYPHRPNSWMPCHVIAEGVESLRTLPMVKELIRLGTTDRLWLVAGRRPEGACHSKLIYVGPAAIHDLDLVRAAVGELPAGSAVMYCAGTPGKVIAWDVWKARPDVTHLDMGHFFDRAYGKNNRMWHGVRCDRRKMYDEHFIPLIRGDR